MQVLRRALTFLGWSEPPHDPNARPNYSLLMHEALNRMRTAELQISEAMSLEELDIARSALQSAQAEVQQLVRTAKRERGIALRPIAENEELHRNLRAFLQNRGEPVRQGAKKRIGAAQ